MAQKLEYTVLDIIESAVHNVKAQPLNLGGLAGAGGGVGAPPAGYIGWLPQTRVAYDETEAATLATPASGMSLLDNLNHIRSRLGTVESGILIVDDWDGSPTIQHVTELTFSGATVTQLAPGHALVVVSGGGGASLTVQEADGSPVVTNVDTIIFSGAVVTDLGSGDVRVTISGGGLDTAAGDARYLKLDASNDPITGITRINVTDFNGGAEHYAALAVVANDPLYNGVGVYGEARNNFAGYFLTYDESTLVADQVLTAGVVTSAPAFWVARYTDISDANTASVLGPAILIDDDSFKITFSGGTLKHTLDDAVLTEINPYVGANGTVAYFNSRDAITASGKLLSVANNDIEKFYVTGSGVVNIPTGATYNINGIPHTHAGREILSANRTYYVRTDGSDSNTGLANSAGGAFLTLQKAWDTISSLDMSTYAATIQIGDGTYTGSLVIDKAPVGGVGVTVQGNSGTPANVILSTSSHCIQINVPCIVTLKDFKLTSSAAGSNGLHINSDSIVNISGLVFDAVGTNGSQIRMLKGKLNIIGNYSITAGAFNHFSLALPSVVEASNITITLTGTPAFANTFASVDASGAFLSLYSITFSGSATGKRYNVQANGAIQTYGGGATYLPGDSAGTTSTGGQYL